ncbi:MAG: sulfatase-like hydrolase/transferase [Armatimonadota bacterium]
MPTRKIVIIMTDTQRADMLGCYGNPDMHTPSLDRLAREGMRFDRAYTCQPVCGPARSAIFTGLYPHTNGSWANLLPLGDNVKTLGQRLRDHELHTAYIGKWHLDGSDYFGLGRCPDGWDPAYWYDMRNYLEELTPEERLRSRDPRTNDDPELTADFTYGHRVSNRAVDFLAQHHAEDFLLTVSYDEPHHPFLCPRPYSKMYKDYTFPKAPNVWDTLEEKPAHHRLWAGEQVNVDRDALEICGPDYFGCNAFIDSEIGRVLAAIDRYAPDALVIYTSDHGDLLQSHCLNSKGAAMYEEITRIPLLVRWPGTVASGSTYAHPASHIDITPTIMDAAGLPRPQWCEGQSLLPALRDPAVRVNEMVFVEFGRFETIHDKCGGFQPIRCVCDGRYKLVINLLSSDEFYDLETDPGELNNLIESSALAAIRNRLHDQLLDWLNRTIDPFRGYHWECRPWRADARPATWSYTGITRQREHGEYEPHKLDYLTGLDFAKAPQLD